MKKIKGFVGIVLSICLLVGCSATELEERCFPLLVSVGFEDGKVSYGAGFPKENTTGQSEDAGEEIKSPIVSELDFVRSKEKYEGRLNKDVDYNHLKVLILEDDFLEKTIAYGVMLENLAETEAFPRNTYVCAVYDIEDLYELEKNISEDLGTYLEEYLKQQAQNKDRLLTLGDLIDEKENEMLVLYLPYLEIEDNFVEWKGYVNTSGKLWQESE